MTEGVLASFEGVYASMGSLGWSPSEVDAMEVWLIARFLGDEDEAFDPVIRGNRGLSLPSDDTGSDRPGRKRGKGRNTFGRFDPRRIVPRTRDPGRVLRGEAAR